MSTGGPPRGTPLQRARAALLRALARLLETLPEAVVAGASAAVGETWYRLAPGRAAVARANLAQVAAWLAARDRGSAAVRAAADDDAALERLVRRAFREATLAYAETARWGATARQVERALAFDTPDAIAAAFARPGPAVWVTLHFGTLAGVGTVLMNRTATPITAPMETLADPELQRLLQEARSRTGIRIVDLDDARRELRAALARGEGVGIVGDRDLAGGGFPVDLFGLPARLPIGPAHLALEADAPLHVAAVRRAGRGYRGRLATLEHPPAGRPRRERVEALLAAEAAAFEEIVADAPEQWGAVFHPIWDAVGPRARRAGVAAPPAGEPS